MSPPTIVAPEDYRFPSMRPVLTFFVFTLLGPAIGGAGIMILLESFGPLGWSFKRAEAFLHAFAFVIPLAYLLGGFQAFVVGALAAIFHLRDPDGPVPIVPVLAGSIVTGLVFVGWTSRGAIPPMTAVLFFLLIHLGAGLACWLIANALLRLLRVRQSASMTSNDQVGIT